MSNLTHVQSDPNPIFFPSQTRSRIFLLPSPFWLDISISPFSPRGFALLLIVTNKTPSRYIGVVCLPLLSLTTFFYRTVFSFYFVLFISFPPYFIFTTELGA